MRVLCCAVLLCGCATTTPPRPAASARADAEAAAVEPATAPVAPATPPGVIRRAELAAVLDASPGYFLQHVQTEPRFEHGRFHGWRLVSFFPGDPRFSGVDLRAGDVVTRVNGRPIEAPDQFMAVWTALKSENELVVDVERDGRPRTLRWTIADK